MNVAFTSRLNAGTTAWDQFLKAQTSDAFCRAWLELVCPEIDALLGAVLVETNTHDGLVPIAVWPQADQGLARLAPAVDRAVKERRGVNQPVSEHPERMQIALPLLVADQVRGAVVVEVPATGASDAMHQLHWGSAWLTDLMARHELQSALQARQRAIGTLGIMATALRHTHFQQALFDLVNDLRQRLHCTRVAFGRVRRGNVKVVALSEAATFEKSSPLVIAYRDAMSEAVDLAEPIHMCTSDTSGAVSFRAHAALMQRSGASSVLSVPVTLKAEAVAIITLERGDSNGFSDDERAELELTASFLAPIVSQRSAAERSSLGRLRDELRRFSAAILGPRHLIWKSMGATLLVLAAVLVFVPTTYRVSADAVVEGQTQREVPAPFDGYISVSVARAGDLVHKGDVLARLDDHDLLVERNKWQSELDQDDNKLRTAMAEHDLSAIRVDNASLEEASAQLELVENRLARVEVRAPFDGVVISGDLSHKVGAPVKQGEQLFQIAPLNDYRIILKVDERDIREVEKDQRGKLMMTGRADLALPFVVAKVTPVAVAKDGRNYFRVEARLVDSQHALLPGMDGLGKIHIGQRKLGWIVTHSMLDWLRLKTWSWTP